MADKGKSLRRLRMNSRRVRNARTMLSLSPLRSKERNVKKAITVRLIEALQPYISGSCAEISAQAELLVAFVIMETDNASQGSMLPLFPLPSLLS